MDTTEPTQPLRAGDAARRFADALAAEALLEQTARLEATLAADGGLETLFAVEQALDLAWPSSAPTCELIWATEAAEDVLRLRAFDDAGRLLLSQAYKGRRHG
ncbi:MULTISPECIES: hypothetical protein [Phenylobacterium]|uniref:Uncharacterized protein n=1 Tax=Phenylobacterium koreense TaxID=266125 RepID=A0ABV2EI89_9CAUL